MIKYFFSRVLLIAAAMLLASISHASWDDEAALAVTCASDEERGPGTTIARRADPVMEPRLAVFSAFARGDAAPSQDVGETRGPTIDNAPWNDLLSRYLAPGKEAMLFDYGAVSADDRAQLESYIAYLAGADISKLSSDAQLALWINLYNARTVLVVLEHYPVSSMHRIKSGLFDVNGPWDDTTVNVGGVTLSLDDIEHKIIRVLFDEPRIHFAVNCASLGCPDLRMRAYEPADLDAALTDATRTYVNDPRGVSFSGRQLILSKVFQLYKEDFGVEDENVVAYVANFADEPLKTRLSSRKRIDGYALDWRLNDAKRLAKEH